MAQRGLGREGGPDPLFGYHRLGRRCTEKISSMNQSPP